MFVTIEDVRARLDELEPLEAPSAWLVNEPAERVGALVIGDEDEPAPAVLDELRAVVGRDPDLYEEFDLL